MYATLLQNMRLLVLSILLVPASVFAFHPSKVPSWRTAPLQSSSPFLTTSTADNTVVAEQEAALFQQLCQSAGVDGELIRLEESPVDSVRGVYVNHNVEAEEVILAVPLSSCLRDDEPPVWMMDTAAAAESEETSYSPSDWATRLAASLMDLQLSSVETDSLQSLWLSLLPDADLLRATLPVHWPEPVVQSARCTALELAVDSAFFARHQSIQDLMDGLERRRDGNGDSTEDTQRLCENALDVVQTRSCRVVLSKDIESWGQPVRLLAPVFDLINHGGKALANAQFSLENVETNDEEDASLQLVVRAVRDLAANEQVLIDYGDSARPAWKCLASYGFVPSFPQGGTAEHVEDDEEEHVAEVYIGGVRYEVGSTTIPEDMVASVASSTMEVKPSDLADKAIDIQQPVELTPDIAIGLARRMSDVAFHLLLDTDGSNNAEGTLEDDESDESSLFSPQDIVSSKLAASLRWNQHHILLACSMGLRDWAVGTDL